MAPGWDLLNYINKLIVLKMQATLMGADWGSAGGGRGCERLAGGPPSIEVGKPIKGGAIQEEGWQEVGGA